jgi:hypothetical protein
MKNPRRLLQLVTKFRRLRCHHPCMARRIHMHWALSLLLCVPAVPALAAGERLEFDVLLDGKPIGTHRFEITAIAAGALNVSSEARFRYRLLGIALYRYDHRAAEQWTNGCLTRIEAHTDDNGKGLAVQGGVRDGQFRIALPLPAQVRASCVSGYAYWDRDRLLSQSELLNPQTGRFDTVTIEALGEEQLQVRGTRTVAARYRLRGDNLQIDLWYSRAGEWLQLLSTVESGKRLHYLRRR